MSVINSHFTSLSGISTIIKCISENLRNFDTNFMRNFFLIINIPPKLSLQEFFELLWIYIYEKKLDYGSHKAFETERNITDLPDIEEFIEFLEKKSTILENLASVLQAAQIGLALVTFSQKNHHFALKY